MSGIQLTKDSQWRRCQLLDFFKRLKIASDCQLCGCSLSCSFSYPLNRRFNLLHQHHQQQGPLTIGKPYPEGFSSRLSTPILCHTCHQQLPLSSNSCDVCGLPLAANSVALTNTPCGSCLKSSPPYDKTVSAFHYKTPIKELITQFKFSAQLQLLPLVCDYLIDKIKTSYDHNQQPKHLIAVPLHPKKQRQRGFNQSQLIARRLAKSFDCELINQGVRRIKHTQAQSGLDSVKRKNNIKKAFQIDRLLPKHIVIIDDVVTTGTTVSELAIQAKAAGAEKIDIWCLARAYEL